MSSDPYQRRVKNVMSKVVVSAQADDSIHEALTLMDENRLSSLPVVDNKNRCVGVLSATDLVDLTREVDEELSDLGRVSEVSRKWLIERLSENELGQQKISQRMTASVVSIDAETTLSAAAGEMLRHRVHHLPVLDEHQHLLGIVSTMDILSAFVEGAPD